MGTDECYRRLGCAIVQQAAEDYLDDKKKLYFCNKHFCGLTDAKRGGMLSHKLAVAHLNADLKSIMKFFRSQWYHELAPHVDGNRLIRMLDEHFENEIKESRKYVIWEKQMLKRIKREEV